MRTNLENGFTQGIGIFVAMIVCPILLIMAWPIMVVFGRFFNILWEIKENLPRVLVTSLYNNPIYGLMVISLTLGGLIFVMTFCIWWSNK